MAALCVRKKPCYNELRKEDYTMAQAQIFEGTSEDIARLLQDGRFAGRTLRVSVNPLEETDEEDYCDTLPDPPDTIRDRAHLEAILLEGINSPKEKVTDQEWIDLRREVRERLAQRDKQA